MDPRFDLLGYGNLEISQVISEDQALYTCVAKNSLGNDSSNAALTVYSKNNKKNNQGSVFGNRTFKLESEHGETSGRIFHGTREGVRHEVPSNQQYTSNNQFSNLGDQQLQARSFNSIRHPDNFLRGDQSDHDRLTKVNDDLEYSSFENRYASTHHAENSESENQDDLLVQRRRNRMRKLRR